jgi:tetratricopeptide (TPR) repeat protein
MSAPDAEMTAFADDVAACAAEVLEASCTTATRNAFIEKFNRLEGHAYHQYLDPLRDKLGYYPTRENFKMFEMTCRRLACALSDDDAFNAISDTIQAKDAYETATRQSYSTSGEASWKTAVETYSTALEKGYPQYYCHLSRGKVLRLQGQMAAALEDFEAAVSAEPELSEGRLRRGELLAHFQRHVDARVDLQKVMELRPATYDRQHIDARNCLEEVQFAIETAEVDPVTKMVELCEIGLRIYGNANRSTMERWIKRACESEPYGVYITELLDKCNWKPNTGGFLYWPISDEKIQKLEHLFTQLTAMESPEDGFSLVQSILYPDAVAQNSSTLSPTQSAQSKETDDDIVPDLMPTFRLTVGDTVRLRPGVVKQNCCLTCVDDIGDIIKDDFDNLPYTIRATSGPKAGTQGFFAENDISLVEEEGAVHDAAFAEARNLMCAASKKKKECAIYANTLVISTPTAVHKENIESAVTLYTKALESEALSNRYACLSGRGECYLKLGENDMSIADFTAAIEEDAERLDAYKSRASAYMQKESWDDAKTDAMLALEKDPTDYFAKQIRDATIQKLFGQGTSDTQALTDVAALGNSAGGAQSDTGFVGLSNQGATCYLNSLLQSLYMTPELRLGVYNWVYDAAKYETIDKCIPAQLQRLFVDLSGPSRGV